MRRLSALLLWLALTAAGPAPKLVAELSQTRVDIEYSFSGVDLVLFGAVSGGPARRTQDYDVVIVMKGPEIPVRVWKRARVAGVWVNAQALRFETAPSVYMMTSTRPLAEMASPEALVVNEIGLDALHFSPAIGGDFSASDLAEFKQGFVRQRQRWRLYDEEPGAVKLVEGVLFRATIHLPPKAPTGQYQADIFLFDQGRVIGRKSIPVEVDKSGFERFIYVLAHQHPLSYGLISLGLAMGIGWLASRTWRRA